mmetsp:Transcript_18504/g.25728  ORF Transcript_18504/g.25728 Transcript_18504/m.25728 type:complete len:279 (-) Transcript_18504:186-1022(-)|eukprot:CAMPEP_0184487822 /NCGR_PEP_ID=MMETSP0113_2-20130426/10356_1 /TAXON_ID=91329 /ORGANISM="Norrisiella sphaerica, Strain BC52" /LENGTH=278 /DNA_ID=CAMNT_0026870233 /DNA_START=43 /DNA_END=879 /DNA_ORIENTATION=-
MDLKEISNVKVFGGYIKQYNHMSKSVDGRMHFGVFVPPGKGKFPVLYYLSGLTCSPKNCIEKGGAFGAAAKAGIMLVFPDTSPRDCTIEGDRENWDFGVGAGFYVDATQEKWKKNYNMFSYVTKELPALIDSEFPSNGTKSITGHSMGGHGALICFLKNPDMYKSVSAFAPICNPCLCPWGEKAFLGYLGKERKEWTKWDATELVKTYSGSKCPILIDQGSADGFYKKKQLLPENFVKACEGANHPVKCRMQADYDHSYYFISTFMPEHIEFHAKALK